jgi:hypothetical protein
MVAKTDAPQLTPKSANDPPFPARHIVPVDRPPRLIEDRTILVVDRRTHLRRQRIVVPARVGAGMPDGGDAVVLDDVGREPLQVFDVPGGLREGDQPITELERAEAPDGTP